MVGIDIDIHQELGPARLIPEGLSEVLYSRGVTGGNISPHDMTPPPHCHHLENDDVQTVEAEILDG